MDLQEFVVQWILVILLIVQPTPMPFVYPTIAEDVMQISMMQDAIW